MLMEPAQHKEKKKNGSASKLKVTDPRLRPYMIMWACFFVVFISLNFVTSFYIQDRYGITDTAEVMRTASLALASMAVR